MLDYALKGLTRSPLRIVLILAGVAFSAFLVLVQAGIFLGFSRNASAIVSNIDADLWITIKGSSNFQTSGAFLLTTLNRVRATPGIQQAGILLSRPGPMRTKQGGDELAALVGFDVPSGMGAPWDIARGNVNELKLPMTAFINESKSPLWNYQPGEYINIMGKKVRVVGHLRGASVIGGSPYAFTSVETFRRIVPDLTSKYTTFVLARVSPGVNVRVLQGALKDKIASIDVYTRDSYALKTEFYWMFQTGFGYAFLFTALLALTVGMLVVGQLMYSHTNEHLPEYGVLKAIGAADRNIYEVLLIQVSVLAVLGYGMGATGAFTLSRLMKDSELKILFDGQTLLLSFGLICAFCLLATGAAVRRAISVDPAIVFRG